MVKWTSFWPNHFKWIHPVVPCPFWLILALCVCHLLTAMQRDLAGKAERWGKSPTKGCGPGSGAMTEKDSVSDFLCLARMKPRDRHSHQSVRIRTACLHPELSRSFTTVGQSKGSSPWDGVRFYIFSHYPLTSWRSLKWCLVYIFHHLLVSWRKTNKLFFLYSLKNLAENITFAQEPKSKRKKKTYLTEQVGSAASFFTAFGSTWACGTEKKDGFWT